MKRYVYFAVVLILLLLLAVTSTLAVVFLIQSTNSASEVKDLQDQLNELKTTRPTPPEGRPGDQAGQPSPPQPGRCDNQSLDRAITVKSPCRLDELSSPLNITGTATGLFEGNMIVDIYDDNDVLLHQEILTLAGGDPGDPIDFD